MSKLIEKAIKRGKNSTSGLGYEEVINVYIDLYMIFLKKNTKTKEIKGDIMKEMEINMDYQKNQQINNVKNQDFNQNNQNISISSGNFNNTNENNEMKTQETIINTQEPLSRQEILSEYASKFKASMQYQFRNSFSSAGAFQPTHNLPTITYIGSNIDCKLLNY